MALLAVSLVEVAWLVSSAETEHILAAPAEDVEHSNHENDTALPKTKLFFN